MIQNNLVGLPRLQYISEYQNNYQYQNEFEDLHEDHHEPNGKFNRDGKKIFLPGKLIIDTLLFEIISVISQAETTMMNP